jgi:hypothetical protein
MRTHFPKTPQTRRVLGIDLGTSCGICLADILVGESQSTILLHMGQWDLSLGKYDSGPLRHLRLRELLESASPDLIMYEEVRFDPPVAQFKSIGAAIARVSTAQEFLGGLKVTVTSWAEAAGIPAEGIAIGQIKKRATGSGVAKKEAIIAAANRDFGCTLPVDDYEAAGSDNIADAAYVCVIGLEQYGDGIISKVKDSCRKTN